jgi:hypothetical protein
MYGQVKVQIMGNCGMCSNRASGEYQYAVLNAQKKHTELLCDRCASLLAGTASVVSIERKERFDHDDTSEP